MENKQPSIFRIVKTIDSVEVVDGDVIKVIDGLNEAKGILKKCLEDMEELTVKGKKDMDMLLGCILATETIIGDRGE